MNWADEMEEWRESEYGEDRDRTLEGSHRSGSHSSPDWLGGTERIWPSSSRRSESSSLNEAGLDEDDLAEQVRSTARSYPLRMASG